MVEQFFTFILPSGKNLIVIPVIYVQLSESGNLERSCSDCFGVVTETVQNAERRVQNDGTNSASGI